MSRILAIDDEASVLEYLVSTIGSAHQVVPCRDGDAALLALNSRRFDLVITDLSMAPPDGFEILRAAQRLRPPVPVIVVTGLDSARPTIKALRLGARDYLIKPAGPAEMRAAVERALGTSGEPACRDCYGLVGCSPGIEQVRRLVPLLAHSRESVLIFGETGTGKELLARAIHERGPRAGGPFVAHNMAATPSDLAESIFFGHVRGAFTSAVSDHAGLFEQAHGGTLFLDEADSFPLPLQAKLLRVLEAGVAQRVGSTSDRPVDVRVVATSAVDLEELVGRGVFRADLYYRLRQLEVDIPPLRERPEDIAVLSDHFLSEIPASSGREPELSDEARQLLGAHAWPGNVRELRNALRGAALLAGFDLIQPGHLPRALQRRQGNGSQELSALRDMERDYIMQALDRVGGNQSLAARLLGIDRGTLARKLRRSDTRD